MDAGGAVVASHEELGSYTLACEGAPELLFTETALAAPKEALGKKFEVSGMDTVQCWLDGFCK